MDYRIADDAPFPRELVFRTHRDEFAAIAARMPEVERVTLRGSERFADGVVVQRHAWVGRQSALPVLLRPFAPKDGLIWEDEARWDPSTWTCAWRVLVPALGPLVEIQGQQRYEARGEGCRVTLDGRFDVFPERVGAGAVPPGAVPWVERFVVSLIVPLVQRSGRAAIDHLAERVGEGAR